MTSSRRKDNAGLQCVIAMLALLKVVPVSSFQWDLTEVLPYRKYFTFSERYMFSTGNGPALMEQGDSYIHVEADIDIYTITNRTVDVAMSIFAASAGNEQSSLDGMCDSSSRLMKLNPFASNIESSIYRGQYEKRIHVKDHTLGLDGDYYHRRIHIDHRYSVAAEAWHNVMFLMCNRPDYYTHHSTGLREQVTIKGSDTLVSSVGAAAVSSSQHAIVSTATAAADLSTTLSARTARTLHNAQQLISKQQMHKVQRGSAGVVHLHSDADSNPLDPVAQLSGTVTFHNPYGFIPAEMYGMLPFEASRMIAYVLFSAYFIVHYYTHRSSVLPLHTAFLVVFLFALVESTLWYSTYQSLNISGTPYCCPFPPIVVASMILQVFRQTFARTLLLVLCLGYGVVRPKLMVAEWIAVWIVSALYLICAIIAQVSDIVVVDNAHGEAIDGTTAVQYRIPEVIMDVIFISWIYLAVSSTIRILTEFQQTVKLNMYKNLVIVIAIFVGLFAAMTIIYLLASLGVLYWPWQLSWLQQIIWESLNFAVLAAVCIICRPAENSRLLSYASQLPTEDPDEEMDQAIHGGRAASNSLFDEEDDFADYGIEMTGAKRRNVSGGTGFDSLPSAEDEEYGLDRPQD